MATPHINAVKGDFAPTVIMPGDPLRSRLIAEKFLTDARLVNNVRGVQGYTGKYKGKPVSVMAHGMGMPSIAIYAHELYEFFGVENIIRTGSAGGLDESLRLRDVILAATACTDGSVVERLGFTLPFAMDADPELLAAAEKAAAEHPLTSGRVVKGRIFTSDLFYASADCQRARKADGIIGVEMETAMLYAQARLHGKRALALLTVSDFPLTDKDLIKDGLSPEERESSFADMIGLALEVAYKIQ